MLTPTEITAAQARLTSYKLKLDDVDSLISSFRLVLGPLEDKYNFSLQSDLEALDDSLNTRHKAAKMAACLIRLENEDFGVSKLTGELVNDDDEQRRLFIVYALSILYKLPVELVDLDLWAKNNLLRKNTVSVPVTFVP